MWWLYLKPKTKNWVNIGQEDFDVAEHLFEKRKYLHCLFFLFHIDNYSLDMVQCQ